MEWVQTGHRLDGTDRSIQYKNVVELGGLRTKVAVALKESFCQAQIAPAPLPAAPSDCAHQ